MAKFFALMFAASIVCQPALADDEDAEGMDRLQAEIAAFSDNPCATRLRLSKILIVGWTVTCDGRAGVPADMMYPKAVLDFAEQWAVNERISFRKILQLTGECP